VRLLLATALAFAACAGSAQAAVVCSPDGEGNPPVVLGSTDNDNVADIVVGLPSDGVVVVRQSLAGTTTLHAPVSGTHFGQGVAVGDLDHDGCADVAVGAPYNHRVYIYRGSPQGVQTDPLVIVGSGPLDEEFGTAVVIGQDSGLWIGAPNRDGGRGGIDRYTLDENGVATLAGTYSARRRTEKERFGGVLAPGVGSVYVGAFRRHHSRGAVERIPVAGPHTVFTLRHGKHGDRLGRDVATSPSGQQVVAGAPGRDHGRGAVAFIGRGVFTLDSPHVPGHARPGLHFGRSVALGRALTCQEDLPFAAGAPGEGSITIVSQVKGCSKRRTFPAYAGKGSELGLRRYRDDFDEDVVDTLLVAAPRSGVVIATPASPQDRFTEMPFESRQVIAVPESGDALRA
jgi:hypothetical protein